MPPIQIRRLAYASNLNKSTISTWLYHLVFIEMDGKGTNFGCSCVEMCMDQDADVYSPEINERQATKVHRQQKPCLDDAPLTTEPSLWVFLVVVNVLKLLS